MVEDARIIPKPVWPWSIWRQRRHGATPPLFLLDAFHRERNQFFRASAGDECYCAGAPLAAA